MQPRRIPLKFCEPLRLRHVTYRRWAGKTSYVRLAPEHVFTIKYLR